MISIRQLLLSDIPTLMSLVRESKPTHIFANEPSSIIYYHGNKTSNSLYVHGAFTDQNILVGAHFFEPIYFHNTPLRSIYGCLLVTGVNAPLGTGLMLIETTLSLVERFYIATNVSPRMKKFHSRLGLKFAEMDNYFVYNPSCKSVNIISRSSSIADYYPVYSSSSSSVKRITSLNLLRNIFPLLFPFHSNAKDSSTLAWKYLENPYYEYDLLFSSEPVPTLIICRRQYVASSYVVKVVEFYSSRFDINVLYDIVSHYFFSDSSCEGAYLYCSSSLEPVSNGIQKLSSDSKLIDNFIPSHFSPFSRKPIFINCCYNDEGLTIFSGDSDQDRATL